VQQYPQQVLDLIGYLSDSLPPDHPFAGVRPGPGEATAPELWLLGSRTESAYMAAMFGLPFSYAQFFGAGTQHGPAIVESYRKHFRPSAGLSEPRVNVAVHVLCAATEAEAQRLAASRNLAKLKSALGQRGGVPTVEEALHYPYTPQERAYIADFSQAYIDGDPQQVKAQLEGVSETYQTTDISIVTICYSFEDRVRSYELVAEACGIKQ
jgi:luciferase family oxidoreductase group 1